MDEILSVGDLTLRPIAPHELKSTLEVYRQCEDFLSLGPVPKASMAMVMADIEHSSQARGIYCGIWRDCTQVGVLDFTPETGRDTTILSLLMIARPYRNQGIGSSVVHALLSYLRATHGTTVLESGVQVNNAAGIAFWRERGFEIDATARKLDDGTTVYSMSRRISTEALR